LRAALLLGFLISLGKSEFFSILGQASAFRLGQWSRHPMVTGGSDTGHATDAVSL